MMEWRPDSPEADLAVGDVHVWRIPIPSGLQPGVYTELLSEEERARAQRLHRAEHRAAFEFTHCAVRTILSRYMPAPAGALRFEKAPLGKPSLIQQDPRGRLEFSLSHSGALALLAVARERAVGVDVEQWNPETDCLEVARRSYSLAESEALRAMAGSAERVVRGFFSAWTRKEAYLKATGHGIGQGLDHFDVSLAPGEPAALVADRRDPGAPSRWTMVDLRPGTGYSGALVVAAPAGSLTLFDAPPIHQAIHASAKPATTSTT